MKQNNQLVKHLNNITSRKKTKTKKHIKYPKNVKHFLYEKQNNEHHIIAFQTKLQGLY